MRIDKGRKGSSRPKKGTYRVVGRGKKSLIVTPHLNYVQRGRGRKKKWEDSRWDEQEKMKKNESEAELSICQ